MTDGMSVLNGLRDADVVIRASDLPTDSCTFGSNNCSASMSGAGGFDRHHKWPEFMGGPDDPVDGAIELLLCPNHHRRQHALIRYLVECDVTRTPPSWGVLRHFVEGERVAAGYAITKWIAAGRPVITGWSSPAARDA